MRPLLALTLLCAAAWPAPARADVFDHLPPGRFAAATTAADTSSRIFVSLILDRNKMAMNITNYGFVGNNFTTRTPSMEYPLGSGLEHLVRGGLWVGAIAADANGAFTGVTTAATDGFTGDAAASATEFSPEGDQIEVRSTLPNDRKFSTVAVSERDLLSYYDDLIPKRAQNNREDHRPLGLVIRQDNYSWSFADYQHMVIFHYVIRNTGAPLRNVWLGIYNELASGPKKNFSVWPPGGAWFHRKQVSWVDSLNMFTERYCQGLPIPSACGFSIAPQIVGVKLLGVTPGSVLDTANTKVTMAAWNFSPGAVARDEDVERYGLLSSGQKTLLDPLPDSLAPSVGDPVELIAVGPIPNVNLGDSITVDFAYIGAPDDASLLKRARTAQRAYDLNYIVPVPPPSPRFHAVARAGAIDLYWDDSPEAFLDPTSPLPRDFEGYRLYVGDARDSLHLIGQFDLDATPNDTTGFNTGLAPVRLAQPVVFDGVTYTYQHTVENLRNGFKYFTAVTAYDLGTTEIESLESGRSQNEIMVVPAPRPGEQAGGITVFPNPYRVEAVWDQGKNVREHYLWFANLPDQCTIRIYTLAGDLVYEQEFDGSTYDGSNARGIFDPANDLRGTFSGAMFGWDLVTRRGQAAATGLYLWSVEDKRGGKRSVGKFLIVKSDREGLR